MSSVSLPQIERRFSTAVSGTIKDSERKEIIGLLQTAYKDFKVGPVSDQWALQMGKIFYLYGRAIYGGEMSAPHSFFKLSTAYQLAGMKKLDIHTLPTLEACEKLEDVATLPCPADFDRILTDLHATDLSQHEEAFSFASSLRWMLATEQNMEPFRTNIKRIGKLYRLASAIQETLNTPESRWELAGMLYNGALWIGRNSGTDGLNQALQLIDRINTYIEEENGSVRSKLLKAQTENMVSLLYKEKVRKAPAAEKGELLKTQFEHSCKADTIATELGTEGDQFLATLFKANLLKLALDGRDLGITLATLDQMEGWAATLLTDMEREKYSHTYYHLFLLIIAKLRGVQGRHKEVLTLLDQAEQLRQQTPSNAHARLGANRISWMRLQSTVALYQPYILATALAVGVIAAAFILRRL